MRWRNTLEHYGLLTKVLHWLTAGLVIGLIGLGWYLASLGFFDRRYDGLLGWHQALGMLVLVLAALTAVWRRVSPSPEPVAGLTALERWAGHAVQYALYALLWLLPASGYVIATANGEPLELFGVLRLPAPGPGQCIDTRPGDRRARVPQLRGPRLRRHARRCRAQARAVEPGRRAGEDAVALTLKAVQSRAPG